MRMLGIIEFSLLYCCYGTKDIMINDDSDSWWKWFQGSKRNRIEDSKVVLVEFQRIESALREYGQRGRFICLETDPF